MTSIKTSTKIYFEMPLLGFPKIEELGQLYKKLCHTSVVETLLYSCEGIFNLDEKNGKVYRLFYNDNESEKISIPTEKGTPLVIYCDYSTVEKREVTKLPLHYNKMKKTIITFHNNSSLKLVLEKNVFTGELIDIYCILDKKHNLNNSDFYEELKQYNNLIFNV